jgi:uncharacterized protein (DUF2236 family)
VRAKQENTSPASLRVFAPGSVMWKIVRHRTILLHGPAAAVLQIAYPRIGLGVMEHSSFESAPLKRLIRTLDAVYAIAFGTHEQADQAARGVANRHARVVGDAAKHDVPGAPIYSADEIDLLMWVVATLVWSAIGGYERCVSSLTNEEKQAFYRDMRVLGTFFGLPTDYGPQTYEQFLAYFEQQLADPLIGSHLVSRKVAWAVARPKTPWWLWLAGYPITFLFSEILPAPVRARLGFKATRFSRFAYCAATLAFRALSRFGPDRLRYVLEYRQALGIICA